MKSSGIYTCSIVALIACSGPLVDPVHAESSTMQDPTKPPIDVLSRMSGNMAASQAQMLVLSGLKTSGGQSVAIVNNTFVKIGDVIQGYRFKGVQGQQAIFEDESHQRLVLKPNIVDYRKFELTKNVSKKKLKRSNANHTK